MSDAVEEQLSFFRICIENRRLDDGTLRVLESLLVSKDVKLLLEVRSRLIDFLRSESLNVIHEFAEKSVDQKLCLIEFLVRAFALVGDVESCLALRYEALTLRDIKSSSHPWLQVSYVEWLTFAENSLDSGFYSIAGRACENALSCLLVDDTVDLKAHDCQDKVQAGERIKHIKDISRKLAASRSVQVQTSEYLKKKTIEQNKVEQNKSNCAKRPHFASSSFRDGIKKRNSRNLHKRQRLQKFGSGSHATKI
ncbi:hypothetical protein RJ641_008856 [Dillenia turbinata]|uniref:Uncharacterized protein n=1 Tax=Dillenia turbinata TaxID=194707 RepID=A0AAN8Z6X7_9MAGN